ncbi:MAG TPA: recombinase family protein [Candidatus Eisenbacteria bacterium]|nr:recombinase family protein [Candidatus Eisenbacteria bacterium]
MTGSWIPEDLRAMGRTIAYIRCSTEEQADSRAGLDAQRSAILAEAQRRGWDKAELTFFEDAGYSGKDLRRPGIEAALDALRRRQGDTLVVSKLDRLSRSMLDFAALMDRASREHWALVALDVGVDTTTPSGEMLANVLAVFAQFERRLIGERTKAALAAKKAQGIQLGRPRLIPGEVVGRILAERSTGATLRAIVAGLNRDSVPTAMGGHSWHVGSVQAVLRQGSRAG